MAGLSIKELENELENIKSQLAKVDKEYVNYDKRGHIFDYNISYSQFLEDIAVVITEGIAKRLDFETRGK